MPASGGNVSIGTALGPSLGGALIAGLGWPAIFLVNLPLGILTFLLAHRYLPADRREVAADRTGLDTVGTLLLALTLAAYALAMTMGRGSFGPLNIARLLGAAVGVGLFVLAEANAASPLIRLPMFRDPVLSAGLAMSAIVSTVMMATLMVGPFYLSRALGLEATLVGLVMSVGPLVAALTGVPAGRIVDRLGAQGMTIVGLIGIVAGSFVLSMTPASLGVAGYIAPTVLITAGYALFQTANNTAVMTGIRPDQRGVISATLNLSRNLGLVTGASLMGAVSRSRRRRTTSPPRVPRPLPPVWGSRSQSRRCWSSSRSPSRPAIVLASAVLRSPEPGLDTSSEPRPRRNPKRRTTCPSLWLRSRHRTTVAPRRFSASGGSEIGAVARYNTTPGVMGRREPCCRSFREAGITAKRYRVTLSDEERERLRDLTREGTASARMVPRAQTLQAGDDVLRG